jgi:hypothetical protein
MFTFAQPRDQVGELGVGHSRAAVQRDRDRLRRDDVGDALSVQPRFPVILAMRVADRRGEHVDAGRLDELHRCRQRLGPGDLV